MVPVLENLFENSLLYAATAYILLGRLGPTCPKSQRAQGSKGPSGPNLAQRAQGSQGAVRGQRSQRTQRVVRAQRSQRAQGFKGPSGPTVQKGPKGPRVPKGPKGCCPLDGSRCIQDCTAKVISLVNFVEQITEILKVFNHAIINYFRSITHRIQNTEISQSVIYLNHILLKEFYTYRIVHSIYSV